MGVSIHTAILRAEQDLVKKPPRAFPQARKKQHCNEAEINYATAWY